MKWFLRTLVIVVALVGIAIISVYIIEPQYAYIPPENNILRNENDGNGIRLHTNQPDINYGYDVWGEFFSEEKAERLLQTEEGRNLLSPENGAVRVDEELMALGREAFYSETFGNEVFITDILGVLDGPLTLQNFTKAILELKGEGTDNLQVELAETIKIGDKVYKKGDKVDTGLDVPKGAVTPLGMPLSFSDGRVRVGISCAVCHATVDRETGMVIEGAPNNNLNAGLILAMASNSAAYFTNAEVEALEDYIRDESRVVKTTDGEEQPLPDAYELEKTVDEIVASWPPGNFDTSFDMQANPAQIPDSFTLGDHPYGWNGFSHAGPFRGLSSLNNNVHAQNTDLTSQAQLSEDLFNIDKEVFLGTILQNAAHEQFRFDPDGDEKPSEFFKRVNPKPEFEGISENVQPPTFPKLSMYTPNGTVVSSPGFRFGEQVNALSVFQNSLFPPNPKHKVDKETFDKGREVFERAGCITCHSGRFYTNNRVISVNELKTQPSRAKAQAEIYGLMEEPYIFAHDTPVPIPNDAKRIKVPLDHLDKEQEKLIYAVGESEGGYKVKGLLGLYWSAPYLHDGGVAVGPNENEHIGVPGTLLKGIKPDPKNSLKALVDKQLRQKVIDANRKSEQLQKINIEGIGHEYWVDVNTGFTEEEQEALIQYLLSLTPGILEDIKRENNNKRNNGEGANEGEVD